MARYFITVPAAGSPNDVLIRVRSWVRQLHCGHIIPVMYFEKNARWNYYIFLGIETESNANIPEEVEQVCARAGLTGQRMGPLTFDEIRTVLDPQEFDTHATDRIPYISRWVHDQGDLVDLLDLGATPVADPDLTARFDHLLIWLSSVGEGRWETFLRACQTLGVADNASSARSVFRRLLLLGHLEASADGREWMICPPVFVQSQSCPTSRFWCGQRTGPLLERLRGASTILSDHQSGSCGPSRVTIELSDCTRTVVDVDPVIARFEWQDQPLSSVLASHLPSLDGWQQSLQPIIGLTNPRKVERWERQRFIDDTSFYIRDGRYYGQPGLYNVTRGEGRHQSQLTFYFDAQEQRLLRGDWYGMRFLALRRAGYDCKAIWHGQNGDGGTLVLRTSERWPMIYERALVLSSGLLPEHPSGSSLLRYCEVPLATAQTLVVKLGVELEVRTDA